MWSTRSTRPGIDRYSQLYTRKGKHEAVRLGRWKLIRSDDGASCVTFELYDLQAYPCETVNLWPSHWIVWKTLDQALAWHNLAALQLGAVRIDEQRVDQLDPKILKQLEALGYLH